MYIEMPFSDCFSRLICVYQSTDAIRKRHLYIHISRLMQSKNGILLLFCIFLSHGSERKWKEKKRGVGCLNGGMLCPVHKYLCMELPPPSFCSNLLFSSFWYHIWFICSHAFVTLNYLHFSNLLYMFTYWSIKGRNM